MNAKQDTLPWSASYSVTVSEFGTGTVYIRDGEDLIVVSPCQIPELIGKLAQALESVSG
jgi:hypothetical protein